jgi:hypothetical protein
VYGTLDVLKSVQTSKMSRVFDYGGTVVASSNPVKKLKIVRKVLSVDSGDRDVVKHPRNGDFTIYLPRVYENVVRLRLQGAEFPKTPTTYNPLTGVSGAVAATELYFLIDIEGLNKTDECSVGANRSGYPDGFFAKIPFDRSFLTEDTFYSDKSQQDNIAHFTPAIGKLDRLHIRTRLHGQKASGHYINWPSEFSLTFEIEYLDNVFDDFSQLETRVSDRNYS